MDGLLDRIEELEKRSRRVEGQLRTWRVLAVLIAVAAVGYVWISPSVAQQIGGVPAINTFKAPFAVVGANGMKLFEVTEFHDKAGTSADSQETLLTMFRNGQPAAMYRTTGKVYKDAYDSSDSYLNVVETWLYRYPRDASGKLEPTPALAASTALTRAGGSIVVFSQQGTPTTTPPIAARLTAKRGSGGAVMLYDQAGNEGKVLLGK